MSKQFQLTEKQINEVRDARLRLSWLINDRAAQHQSVVDAERDLMAVIQYGTSDGKPRIDPPLTDSDACNRIPVMARDRDCDSWKGPFVLLSMTDEHFGCCVRSDEGCRIGYRTARRLTSSEMAEWRAKK